jgi:glucosamine--fructose-6-phosphate aminotransferase (isomerizing)
MCGIVGYVGKKRALPVLLDGLKNLEYRGYDSAGLVVIDNNNPYLFRSVGRVGNLQDKISGMEIERAQIGIAHTRWATHGKASEENAHPHSDCKGEVFVVHNGIIENYKELREELMASGHIFKSETDTEVLAHLAESEYSNNKDTRLFDVLRSVLRKVRGTYGIAMLSVRDPEVIVAARNSSPLLLGVGDDGNIVASDASAVIRHTKKVIYLQDEEIVEIGPNGIRVETLDFEKRNYSPQVLDWDIESVQKDGHANFLHKEIFEIPDVIRNSIRGRIVLADGTAKLGGLEEMKDRLRSIENIICVACGTAHYATCVGEYMFEEYAGISSEANVASEFRYKKQILDSRTALLAVSQSGETADTLAAIREAKEKNILSLGIVNVVGSSLARETDAGVYNHAGPEISVASTKAFASQLTVLSLLTVFLGRQKQMSLVTGKRILEEVERLPGLVEEILSRESLIKDIASKYKDTEHFMYLGRKYMYPIALEGALKLKELTYIHAEGQPAGEIKHGFIAMIDKNFPSFILAPKDSVYDKSVSNIEEIKARSGPVIAVTTDGNVGMEKIADDVIYIPKTLEMLTPILAVIPTYLFAYHMALLLGRDIDKPRNLAKSVTVE